MTSLERLAARLAAPRMISAPVDGPHSPPPRPQGTEDALRTTRTIPPDRHRSARRSVRHVTWLVAVRRLLVNDTPTGSVDLLTESPDEWRGEPLAVHDAPIAGGTVSYAVRWHGPRPALLWETTANDVSLRAPALDPDWSTTDARGEALFGVTEPQC